VGLDHDGAGPARLGPDEEQLPGCLGRVDGLGEIAPDDLLQRRERAGRGHSLGNPAAHVEGLIDDPPGPMPATAGRNQAAAQLGKLADPGGDRGPQAGQVHARPVQHHHRAHLLRAAGGLRMQEHGVLGSDRERQHGHRPAIAPSPARSSSPVMCLPRLAGK